MQLWRVLGQNHFEQSHKGQGTPFYAFALHPFPASLTSPERTKKPQGARATGDLQAFELDNRRHKGKASHCLPHEFYFALCAEKHSGKRHYEGFPTGAIIDRCLRGFADWGRSSTSCALICEVAGTCMRPRVAYLARSRFRAPREGACWNEAHLYGLAAGPAFLPADKKMPKMLEGFTIPT